MTDTLLALVPQYGAALLMVVTFLSCLALPVPASIMMLTGGAFAAGGDLSLLSVAGAAFAGAVAGDQAGYAIGRFGEGWIDRQTRAHPRRLALLERARAFSRRWGAPGVFFSRWLVSPLGPYVNFLSGAADVGWRRFALWAMAGEAVWVGLYVGLGYGFASRLEAVAEILGNVSGALAAGLVTVLLGLFLWKRMREEPQE